jgi:D-alanyl-lipoteichoic acid acyltransferase DltB (MBOAT superfamily)
MLFNSAEFAAFFPVVTLVFFALGARARVLWLLVASSCFYMAFIPSYILILYAIILVDYAAGRLIERSQGQARRAWLGVSLAGNLGLLSVFKYFDFASDNLAAVAAALGWSHHLPQLGLVLPIGLSFHTFQAMSYTIEVYRGTVPAERSIAHYALYVLFYPQLVAGPIERPGNLLPQLHAPRPFAYARVTDGLKLMAWGLFKKVVIADRFAPVVSCVYNQPLRYDGVAYVVATVLFAFQIYCDFSGYSDIAIGAAEVMGIRLMTNFDRPYHARSIGEFWHRWHISLSTWFRDYVYLPLGGSRGSLARTFANVLLVFVLSGLWHGASWTFVIWGALHGAFRVIEMGLERSSVAPLGWLRLSPRVAGALRRAWVFALVCVAWIFFRARSLADAVHMATNLHTGWGSLASPFELLDKLARIGLTPSVACLSVGLLAVLETVHLVQESGPLRPRLAKQPFLVRWTLYYALILGLVVLGVYSGNQFIYFQF